MLIRVKIHVVKRTSFDQKWMPSCRSYVVHALVWGAAPTDGVTQIKIGCLGAA